MLQTKIPSVFGVGSKRGCKRYHIDNVPYRLLVTYAGKGTEWLPDEASDRGAYDRGETNENIIKDQSAKQEIHRAMGCGNFPWRLKRPSASHCPTVLYRPTLS